MTNEQNKHIHALWIGDRLSPLELLCIYSYINSGHCFHLWLYESLLTPLPKEVIVEKAGDILPQNSVFAYENSNQYGHGKGSYAGFSDIFRYKLLYEKGGWWTDMDVICLKPLDFWEPYVFRTHHDFPMVGNIMKCPPQSELMKRCYEEAAASVNASNTDWNLPIKILNHHIAALALKTYIQTFSNTDHWDHVKKYILFNRKPDPSWRILHMVNEDWKKRGIDKNHIPRWSFTGRLLSHYRIRTGCSLIAEIKTFLKIFSPVKRFKECYWSVRKKLFLLLPFFFFLFSGIGFLFAQDKENFVSAVPVYNPFKDKTLIKGVSVENTSKTPVRCIFWFDANGFYDEETLKAYLLRNTDSIKCFDENQLLVLENIARIIKSPAHRNFHLLFSSANPTVSRKKYSPLAMLTSFYDKQCHDYQRLAAQMALLTPYFKPEDFISYNILNHNIIDVRIDTNWVFHDFDPGQPGFRFYKSDSSYTYASYSDLAAHPALVKKEQFYTYNGQSLCPWISESYYRSSFSQLKGQGPFAGLKEVYGFIPRWTIPPGALIRFSYPETSLTARFGSRVFLDKKNRLIKKTFRAYSRYKSAHDPADSLKMNMSLNKYLIKNFHFDFDINYYYLINSGIVNFSDSTRIETFSNNNFLQVNLKTDKDTLWFGKEFLIPLPLHKIRVKSGFVVFTENTYTENTLRDTTFVINDSLTAALFNEAPPVFTPGTQRISPVMNDAFLIYGPARGYVPPHSEISFEYYYNPYYYSFSEPVVKVVYDKNSKGRLLIKYFIE